MRDEEWSPGRDRREYIARTDGKPFNRVALRFGPFNDNLPRDYEFSLGFTDGSTAVHSGHLDVTADPTRRAVLIYLFEPLPNEGLVFNAKEFKGATTWSPEGDVHSIYVYFGKISPLINASLTTLADPGLPDWLQKLSETALPAIFKLYEEEFRQHPNPFVIVNVGDLSNENESTSGGGSAPGWIQMGLAGGPWKKRSPKARERFLATLAHEGMHQFQGRSNKDFMEVAWIMEGSAEFFTYQALRKLNLISEKQLKARLARATMDCESTLKEKGVQIKPTPSDKNFNVVYSCGHLLHNAAHLALLKKNPGGLFDLWRKLEEHAKSAHGYYNDDGYFKALKDLGASEQFQSALREFIFQPHPKPKSAIQKLMAAASAS